MTRKPDPEAIETLRELLPVGSAVHLVLRSVARSGMSRRVSPLLITHDAEDGVIVRHLGALVSRALALPAGDDPNGDGIRVGGVGMDMGFWLVSSLSRELHGDPYALKHRWL